MPDDGGVLRIGLVGNPRYINPILLYTYDVDQSLASLIFKGLFKIDGRGGFEPDLAKDFSISKDKRTYTVSIKDGVKWQDGEALTSDDVVFTVRTIQNAAWQSPQRQNWAGVNVEAVDQNTVRFTLPNPYNSFIQNLTLKIIPKHIWSAISPERVTLTDYNLKPIGSGPFIFSSFQKEQSGFISRYTLKANPLYFEGKPYLDEIEIVFYSNETDVISGLLKGEIDAYGTIDPKIISLFIKRRSFTTTFTDLPRYYSVFFNNESEPTKNPEVRQALEMATPKAEIIKTILAGQGEMLQSPFSPKIFPYLEIKDIYNPDAAKKLLEKNGWIVNAETGFRQKLYKKISRDLEINLITSQNENFVSIASLIKDSWEKIGAKVNLKVIPLQELEAEYIRPRNFDALLFGEVIGQNPDLYSFWHSSQKFDPGLNLSVFTSKDLDRLIEELRQSPGENQNIIESIQKIFIKNVPAVFLYAPRYAFIKADSFTHSPYLIMNSGSDIFNNVNKWYKNTKRVLK